MLSIIIPTYNEEKYLPNLLKSIKNQTMDEPYEIIIADNNSTDRTIEIAQSYGCIITFGGLPGAGRNAGAKIAKGDVLLFLDADVQLLSPYFLIDSLDDFEYYNLGCATNFIIPLNSKKKFDLFFHEAYNILVDKVKDISPFAPGFCLWATKENHNKIGGFDEEITLGEDSDYIKRLSKITKFGILRDHKIPVSVRRLDRDGRINVVCKYVLAGLHMMVLGNVKTNIFNYQFGYGKETSREKGG